MADLDLDRYYDLIDDSATVAGLRVHNTGFDCELVDESGKRYDGFILAKSPKGQAYTVCDVSFHYSATDKRHPPRLVFRATNQVLDDQKVRAGESFRRIPFQKGEDGYRGFWRMVAFLSKYQDVVDMDSFVGDLEVVSRSSMVKYLQNKPGEARLSEVAEIIKKAGVQPGEMETFLAHKSRIEDLERFRKLLHDEENARADYRTEFGAEIKGAADEAMWHHFLSNHKWIFGLSLKLRFIEDFVDEAAIGNPDTTNTGNPKTDMLGWADYTVLVELKTPETDIFTERKTSDARAKTWSFTNPFIEGFSQCLAQKTEWEENHNTKDVITEHDGHRTRIDRGIIRTIDPQVIFIVGNKAREIPKDSRDDEVLTKRDTLERFIQNNRNVNIISYDELYTRAYFIVHGEQPSATMEQHHEEEFIDLDSIPF